MEDGGCSSSESLGVDISPATDSGLFIANGSPVSFPRWGVTSEEGLVLSVLSSAPFSIGTVPGGPDCIGDGT